MSTFGDRYRVLHQMGTAGLSRSYAAYDHRNGRRVVLRFMPPDRAGDASVRRRFLREARAAAAIAHPFVCRTYDVIEADGAPAAVLEYVEGQTALERTAGGPLEPREVARLGRELAQALSAVHGGGMVHGAVTGSNVMITVDGHVKLIDVGIAHAVADTAANAAAPGDVPSRTMLLGTPVYVAPEVLQGGPVTSLSDLYGAGVVLYRLATGTLPFPERTTHESLTEMLTQPPVPPGLLVAGLPQTVERAIMVLLEKRPELRFPSADSLAATLSVFDRPGS